MSQRLFWNDETSAFDLYRARPGQNAGTNINDPTDDRPLRLPDIHDVSAQIRVSLAQLIGQKLEVYANVLNVFGLSVFAALMYLSRRTQRASPDETAMAHAG